MNMQAIMQQAQKMQKDILKKKEEVAKMTFEGKSELVTVLVNGNKEVISVKFNHTSDLSNDDLEVLEDMTVIAINDALSKVNNETEKAMGPYASSLNGLI
jgi:DNA-binding YbaB/EbfC family protein